MAAEELALQQSSAASGQLHSPPVDVRGEWIIVDIVDRFNCHGTGENAAIKQGCQRRNSGNPRHVQQIPLIGSCPERIFTPPLSAAGTPSEKQRDGLSRDVGT